MIYVAQTRYSRSIRDIFNSDFRRRSCGRPC